MNSLLDLRFVIGLFFLIIGVLLLIFSFVSQGNGVSINLWSGIAFSLFGLFMLFLSFRKDASDEILDHPTQPH